MSKNTKLLYCILGSAILSLLNNPLFERTIKRIFDSGMEFDYFIRSFLVGISYMLSLIGIVLLVVFSILLIVWNVNFKSND